MRLSALALLLALPLSTRAGEPDKDSFVPMFDGKTLKGWVNVNTHPSTFFVRDGEIVTTGTPTGFLRTEKHYENFILEMEWKHVEKTKMANSGLFVWGDPLPAVGTPYTRGIEVQVLANAEVKDSYTSDGDVFSIWGARCKPDRPHPKGAERCLPSEKRTKPAGEWNHYKVIANDGVIKLHVNGKEVSGVSQCTPRKGYLALESEGAECHFRNLKIKELPSTNPKPEQVAKLAEGHRLLFNGLDLDGWKTEKDTWKAGGGSLRPLKQTLLASEAKYAKGELVFDWKVPAKATGEIGANIGGAGIVVYPDGTAQVGVANGATVTASPKAAVKGLKPGAWNRTVLTFDGTTATATVNGQRIATVKVATAPPATPVLFHSAEGLELMSIYVRELKEK